VTEIMMPRAIERGRIITGPDCVAEGTAWLAQIEPRFAQALAQTGQPPLRLRSDGFEALFQAIVSQQVSVASATAIWSRVEQAGLAQAKAVALASDAALQGCGLSRPKVRYARALAEAQIDYAALRDVPDAQVIARLTAVCGIGPWTAQIYAMFALGRADAFAPGDLALQEGVRMLWMLDARPKDAEMHRLACRWSPWRSVAARLLWAYFKSEKDREGLL
jgi:DNA-3-methyladenine glycosylase II